MPGVIMMGSLFVLFVVEMWLNTKTGGHSHGSATGEEFGANRAAAPGIQTAFNNPLRRNSYDSQMTMVRDEKKGWVENS
jgi:solute carrier family 39 (zinc transporter), member 1/2/3